MPPSRDSAGAIAEIKKRLNIVDTIQRTVSLQKMGRNYRGLCPFHSEKSPSFYVYTEGDGSYHCFGCKASGDIFNFVMETQGLAFSDSLKQLAGQAGVDLPDRSKNSEVDQRKERLRQLLDSAATYFHKQLLEGEIGQAARDYLLKRGVNAAGVTSFNLGYAPNSWDSLHLYLKERGYTAEEMRDAGVLREREAGGFYDYFRDRLIFPIRDLRGQTVGFGGRALKDEDKPKYLNSPQTALFDKGSILYGIDLARAAIKSANQVVIVEGYLDALIAQQFGQNNVVATLGTALTEKHIAQLKRLTRNVVLALDADAAGDRAALKDAEQLRQGMEHLAIPVYNARGLVGYEHRLDAAIRIAVLPPGDDPDDVIRRSTDEWQAAIAAAKPIVDHYFTVVSKAHDLDTPQGRRDAVVEVAPLVASVGNPVERDGYVQQLARLVKSPLDSVQQAIRQALLRRPPARRPAEPSAEDAPPEDEDATPKRVIRPRRRQLLAATEDEILGFLLRYPQQVHAKGGPEFADFSRTESRLIFAALLECDAAALLADRKASGVATPNPRQTVNFSTTGGIDKGDTIENDGPIQPYPMLASQLEEGLQEELVRLWQGITDKPELFGPAVEKNLQKLLRVLRDERDKIWLRRQSQMIAEAHEEGDEAAFASLLSTSSTRIPTMQSNAPPPSMVIRDSRDGRP